MNDAIQPPNRPTQESVNPDKDTTAVGNKGQTVYAELRFYRRKSDGEIGREISRKVLNGPEDLKQALDRIEEEIEKEEEKEKKKEMEEGKEKKKRPVIDLVYEVVYGLGYVLHPDFVKSDVQPYMTEVLKYLLPPSDCENFRQHGLAVADETSLHKIRKAMDEFILQAASVQGPSIFLHPMVLRRVTEWALTEDDGDRLWKELGSRFALLNKVVRGKGKARLDPWWVVSWPAIIKELRTLKKIYLQTNMPKQHSLSKQSLLDFTLRTIDLCAADFPTLRRIEVAFQKFVESEIGVLRNLLDGTLSPAQFTGQLAQSMTNYKPESVQQIVSRLGWQRRSKS